MTARRLVIEAKQRPYPLAVASPDHFRVRDAGAADPAVVLSPRFSLYCLDHDRRRALFVETGPQTDLTTATFYYQAQYEAATALVAVPYETLHALARQVRVDDSGLVLMFSVGRCGSTLAGRAFAAAGIPVCSEPDAFTQLVSLRAAGRCDDATLADLVRSCAQLTFRAQGRQVVKFRSFAIELAELLLRGYPAATVVFLYRQAHSWTQSSLRAFSAYDPAMEANPMPGPAEPARGAGQTAVQNRLGLLVPLLAHYRARVGRLLSPLECLACQWVRQMHLALSLYRSGVPVYPMRYEDLAAAPLPALASLFARCGVTPDEAQWLAVQRVLHADSQAGTSLSRLTLGRHATTWEEALRGELNRVIADLSTVVTPHTILPVPVPR